MRHSACLGPSRDFAGPRRAAVAALFAAATLALASPAAAGAIRCAIANTPAEFAICNSEDLQELDGRIDTLYRQQYATAASLLTQTGLLRDHTNWIRQRNDCRSDLGCLERFYRYRLTSLSQAERPAGKTVTAFKRFGADSR